MPSSRWDRYISIVWENSILWTGCELESTLRAPAAWNRLITNPFPQFTVLLISNYVSNLMQNRMRTMLSPYRSVRVKPWSVFFWVTDVLFKSVLDTAFSSGTPLSRSPLRCISRTTEWHANLFQIRPDWVWNMCPAVPQSIPRYTRWMYYSIEEDQTSV